MHKGNNKSFDCGAEPYAVNIEKASMQNQNYRTALWTGNHLQLTLMSIPVGGDIGLEVHHDTDQFIRIESGNGWHLQARTKTGFVPVGRFAEATLSLSLPEHGTT